MSDIETLRAAAERIAAHNVALRSFLLRLLAKASGLLDNPDDGNEKPSVIDVNVVAPSQEASDGS